MIAPQSQEFVEAVAALENNKHFKAVTEWIAECGQANLDATNRASELGGGEEATFRALGSYHTLNEISKTIAQHRRQ